MNHADKNDKSVQDDSQMSLYEYQLKEVNVRLVLNETSVLYSTTPIMTHEDAAKVMGDLLRGADREMVCVVNMDNKLRPINYNVVSIGSIDAAMVPIANCFKSAILANASSVLLLHSHPSGDPSPSQEDIEVTKRFVQAGNLLGINTIDHIVIGAYRGEQYSFREHHPDMFYMQLDLSVFPELAADKGSEAANQNCENMKEYSGASEMGTSEKSSEALNKNLGVSEKSGDTLNKRMGLSDNSMGIEAHEAAYPSKKSSLIGRLTEKQSQLSDDKVFCKSTDQMRKWENAL